MLPLAWAPVMATQYHHDRFWWIPSFRAVSALGTPLRLFVPAYDNRGPTLLVALFALALVQLGWRPSQPLAIYGNAFNYRAPLEWYLPRQPSLYVSRPLGRVCGTVFLVRRGETRGARTLASERVGRFVVVRMNMSRPLVRERFLRGSTLLADRASCVHEIRRGHLAPLA